MFELCRVGQPRQCHRQRAQAARFGRASDRAALSSRARLSVCFVGLLLGRRDRSARVPAVHAQLEPRERTGGRARRECRCNVRASTNKACEALLSTTPELARLITLATDGWHGPPPEFAEAPLSAADWEAIDVDPNQPCLLQYTSGSTSEPKGVLLTHAQVCANLSIIYAASGPRIDGPVVTWLPPYHDMGLIGTLLFALHRGSNIVVQLSPSEAFVHGGPSVGCQPSPGYCATATATPNFALELCLRRIPPAQQPGSTCRACRSWPAARSPPTPQASKRSRKLLHPTDCDAKRWCPATAWRRPRFCFRLRAATPHPTFDRTLRPRSNRDMRSRRKTASEHEDTSAAASHTRQVALRIVDHAALRRARAARGR